MRRLDLAGGGKQGGGVHFAKFLDPCMEGGSIRLIDY